MKLNNLSTSVIGYPLMETLLNSTSIAIAYFDMRLKISGFNTGFSQILKLNQSPATLYDLDLFSEEELDHYLVHWKDQQNKEYNFANKIIHDDGTILIANIRLIGEFKADKLTGGLIILDDITLKESTQIALSTIVDNYIHNGFRSFANNLSESISSLFNIPIISVSTFDKRKSKFIVRHLWFSPTINKASSRTIKLKSEFKFSFDDLTIIEKDHTNNIFYTCSADLRNRLNELSGLSLHQSEGVFLLNREREIIGCLTLGDVRPFQNLQLIHEILPIFGEKISFEILQARGDRKLKESEELFRNTYENSPLGMMMISEKDGTILKANPRLCKMLGYSESELQKMTAYQITHPEDQNKHKKKFEELLSGIDDTLDFEKRYIKKDRSILWVNIAVSIVKDIDDLPLYDLATVQDITDKYQAKKLIREQVETLNLQNQKLEKYIDSNLQLENFAYIASHDLKAPLRTIGNFAQLLKRKRQEHLSFEEEEYMNFIIDGVKDMNHLINDLLIYSKINSTENTVSILNLPHILNNVIRNLDAIISETKAKIIINEIPESIIANKTKITQLFQNLIANGIKFQKKDNHPEIKISCEKVAENWIFKVSDNGIGIESQYHDQIFSLFKRLHGKAEYEGSGIGLAYCKRVVEKHGGDIWLNSEKDKGTTFIFTIKEPAEEGIQCAEQTNSEII